MEMNKYWNYHHFSLFVHFEAVLAAFCNRTNNKIWNQRSTTTNSLFLIICIITKTGNIFFFAHWPIVPFSCISLRCKQTNNRIFCICFINSFGDDLFTKTDSTRNAKHVEISFHLCFLKEICTCLAFPAPDCMI